MTHYRSFDDYLQASQSGEELKLENYKDIVVPDDTPEPIRVKIEDEPKTKIDQKEIDNPEKPKKKTKK